LINPLPLPLPLLGVRVSTLRFPAFTELPYPRIQNTIDHGAIHTMRAVMTTGAVAAFGFLPMALATGAGAEVQRPLATVVIGGILFSTFLTLFVLPGVLRIALSREPSFSISGAGPLSGRAGGT